MLDNAGMYQGYSVEGSAELKIKPEEMNTNSYNKHLNGMICTPVYECPQERCIHREIVHEVPQD